MLVVVAVVLGYVTTADRCQSACHSARERGSVPWPCECVGWPLLLDAPTASGAPHYSLLIACTTDGYMAYMQMTYYHITINAHGGAAIGVWRMVLCARSFSRNLDCQ